jgi:hypothetical protein
MYCLQQKQAETLQHIFDRQMQPYTHHNFPGKYQQKKYIKKGLKVAQA